MEKDATDKRIRQHMTYLQLVTKVGNETAERIVRAAWDIALYYDGFTQSERRGLFFLAWRIARDRNETQDFTSLLARRYYSR